METNVYFCKKNGILLIAYQNGKNQNVFLQVSRADYAPFIEACLICDNSYDIEKVITNCYEYPIMEKKYMKIGVKYKHIWKPFIINNVENELEFTISEAYRAKRDLQILIEKMQELLLFVEPSNEGLKSYSHKARELLFLACSDFESMLKKYNFGKNERMNDYIEIMKYIDLSKFKIQLVGYSKSYKCSPFENWNVKDPSKSLSWYYAYNQLKHNIDKNFHLATLENCINAISANIILFTIRYSTNYIYVKDDTCSSLIRGSFDYRIENSMDFYIPIFEGERSYSGAFVNNHKFYNGKVVSNTYDIVKPLSFVEI